MSVRGWLTSAYVALRRHYWKLSLRHQSSMLRGILKPNMKVLDIGSGSCEAAKQIREDHSVTMTCLDIADWSQTDIRPVTYDGKKIPFADKSFDAVLISFTLHHSGNVSRLLREARRVAKSHLLIFEDTPVHFFDRFTCNLHGNIFSMWFSQVNKCKFLSRSQWKQVFFRLGLKVKIEKSLPRMRDPIYPVARTLFVLTKI